MRRRRFLALGLGAGLVRAQKPTGDSVTATATQDRTPRVAIVLSSFTQSADHDGTPIAGLPDPRPRDAELTPAQIDAMVRRAIEIGDTRKGDLARLIAPDEWVAIKIDLSTYPGASGYVRGMATEPGVVKALVGWLAEKKRGGRFTIADAAPAAAWDAEFDGLSYRRMVTDFARRYPEVRFELQDFRTAPGAGLPVPGRPSATYRIPNLIQQCDRLITVAPLKPGATMANYLSIARAGDKESGAANESVVDLFSYHPADYAIAGGCWSTINGAARRSNLVLAGFNAMAVDAVGATILGAKPEELPLLRLAWKKGFGIYDVDSIWTRGNELAEARIQPSHP